MKTPKERLQKVIVIGANPAGIAAANKLGEMGIPVTLIDRDGDLNRKLSAEEWRLPSGVGFNFANRPGLIRILRNERIKCLLPAEVRSIKHTPQGFSVRYRRTPSYVDPNRCTLCGRCAEICPACGPDGSKPVQFNGRQALPGRVMIDKRKTPLCQAGCPLGVNVQGYVALARAGKLAEALDLIRRDNVLPGICGRVCTHPCEAACRRSELDEPVAIRDIKRFVADRAAESPGIPAQAASRSERVAVVGSGPSGLAASADLARLGYAVTVFDREQQPGGLLRYGIGPYRLPRDVVDREIEFLEQMGVQFRMSASVDLSTGLASLSEQFSAVILATGAWSDRKLGVPGEDLAGVEGCLSFLSGLYRSCSPSDVPDQVRSVLSGPAVADGAAKSARNAAVIGDGNAAFEAARALVRLGARVTLLSWFPPELIPADPSEIAAASEEGISIATSLQAVEFIGRNGKLKALRCVRTRPGEPDAKGMPWPVPVEGGEPFDLDFDLAIVAIGQKGDAAAYGPNKDVLATPHGYMRTDTKGRTPLSKVFAAGDAVSGPSTVVEAMASGRRAASAAHAFLSGLPAAGAGFSSRPQERDFRAITPDLPSLARVQMAERQASSRMHLSAEVALGLTEEQVYSECSRCLQCGVCSECLQCEQVCTASRALSHGDACSEESEQAGAVIIADPDAAPGIKGEDVLRAYSTKSGKPNVSAMMVRGFAAAAEAMLLLGSGSHRMKGHGVAFSPPGPQLTDELRTGLFICRCGDSLGWSPGIDDYIAALPGRTGAAHCEVLPSACSPEGSASILRTIREKGLTRFVLASCVCCPLDFVCSACTDQRGRLKDTLFHGTGISRAMAETCNLRGEVLTLLKHHPELAEKRFAGLIERSIGRVAGLKSLPAPARPYNFTTAIIGDCEAALRSGLTLGRAGMEVFLFGTPDRALSSAPDYPNVHAFVGSRATALSGTVGNFRVLVETGGGRQTFHAGAVILGEQFRQPIPYLPMAGLPSHAVIHTMQERGVRDVPFFNPGATSIPGLFVANPPGINVSERIKGTAAAILAATTMPRGPRQNKGYTVAIDKSRCRGCGRCLSVCPYKAVSFLQNELGAWYAIVDEALCKGCGDCISVCPSNAADSPYRDRFFLERMIQEILE